MLWIMAAGYLVLTIDEKVKMVCLYSINGENAEMTRKQLYQEVIAAGRWDKVGVDRAPLPPRTTIININRVFNETGCVDKTILKSFSKRTKRVTTAENLQQVKEEVLRSPNVSKSHRRLSATLGIAPSSIYAIFKELKLKPYIFHI